MLLFSFEKNKQTNKQTKQNKPHAQFMESYQSFQIKFSVIKKKMCCHFEGQSSHCTEVWFSVIYNWIYNCYLGHNTSVVKILHSDLFSDLNTLIHTGGRLSVSKYITQQTSRSDSHQGRGKW